MFRIPTVAAAITTVLCAFGGTTHAQPKMATHYQEAARRYDEAAAKTACPANAACYRQFASHSRCLAGELSSAAQSCESGPTCNPEPCPQTADGKPLGKPASGAATTAAGADVPPPGFTTEAWKRTSPAQRAIVSGLSAAHDMLSAYQASLEAQYRREAVERRQRERANQALVRKAARELKAARAERHYKAFVEDEYRQCRSHIIDPEYFFGHGPRLMTESDAEEMYAEIGFYSAWQKERQAWEGWVAVEQRILTGELFVAVAEGNAPSVRALLEAGASVDTRDAVGKTAFEHALEGDDLDVKLEVLEGGLVPTKTDRYFTNLEVER
jgi:hypothetical protein